jgi:hypothetical protein
MIKFTDLLLVAIAPIIVILYGVYLFSLGESMIDLAGFIMIITGVVSLILSVIAYFILKPKKWYYDLLIGVGGVILVFGGFVIYARLVN